jgi:flavin reductase (DIM6/NTAB) family NADH-FMN oxidoreductase RutF
MISVACINGPERVKDTTNNVKTGNGFTVNIISVPFVEQANACSINAPQETGEWPVSGLTKEPSVCGIIFMKFDSVSFLVSILQLLVKAPRVKESAFSMECEVCIVRHGSLSNIDIIIPKAISNRRYLSPRDGDCHNSSNPRAREIYSRSQ